MPKDFLKKASFIYLHKQLSEREIRKIIFIRASSNKILKNKCKQ